MMPKKRKILKFMSKAMPKTDAAASLRGGRRPEEMLMSKELEMPKKLKMLKN